MSNQKPVETKYKVNPNDVVEVRRQELPNGFRFTAVLANGQELVLRAKATRPYLLAVQHLTSVNTKFWHHDGAALDHSDVRGYFTFHSNVSAKKGQDAARILRIVVPAAPQIAALVSLILWTT